jgi:hypothetical protein
MSGPFALYPEEQHWWSFNDYQAVLEVVRRLRPKTVLEFGPGSSTLALIEGGAEHIDACEDDRHWFDVYEQRLARRYPNTVQLYEYAWSDPLRIPPIDGNAYDLALIDGPYDTPRRPAVLVYCLARCRSVLIPTEDYKVASPPLRPHIAALAAAAGRPVEIFETGPLSGAFALIGEPC